MIFIFLECLLIKNPSPVPEGGERSLGEEVPIPLARLLLAMPSPLARSLHPQGWKTEADPDTVTPQTPRFIPKRTPGVQSPLTTGAHSPADIFLLFFDYEALKLLLMSRDSFRAIVSNLHMSDPKDTAVNDLKRSTKEYNHLQKASLPIKQYMKAKPTKWGLKFFVLVDVNGHTVDYRLYTGKNGATTGKGLSFDVVTTLVNKDYLGSGYTVYCDNFYSSPHLFHHRSQQGFGACGTYRTNRAGMPKTQDNALKADAARGSIRWIRDGELLFIKWMDTREVSILTTVHPVYTGETVMRWQQNADGVYNRVAVPRPTAISEYNKYMGGVDTSDQMLGTASVHRKTKRWPTTVLQHMLDIAVTNSFITHKELMTKQ
ncbi:hypothetical protein ACEWY4_003852 [Coilia grayii]|uniref:PiggyBac transposable element-derived protein domain-containing protein n=1 Tax=Coilia grayii TaxID=363190 RepID=A0ABD1KT10_9TELE